MSAILFLGLLAVMGPGAGDEPRWYLVELEGGERLSVKFISEDDSSYVLGYQGSPLRVVKSSVLSLTPLAAPSENPSGALAGNAHGDGKSAPGNANPAGKAGAGQEAFRDAVESLGSADDAEVRRAYKVLAASFADARPLIHGAIVHPNPRVRALSVKLLGEKGSAKEDLKVVASRLIDDKVSVRRAAVFAIRNFGPDGYPQLVRAIDTEPDANNRKLAVKTLQHWGDRRAVVPLVTRLGREPDGGVRNFIAVALRVLTRRDLGTDAKAWESSIAQERQREESVKMAREQATERANGKENEEKSDANE